MILVKIENGEVVKFPYTLDDLRMDHPMVSFPLVPSSEILDGYSAKIVLYHPYPVYDKRTQRIEIAQVPTLIDGVWTMNHAVVDKTEEEIAAYDLDKLVTFRADLFNKIDAKTNERITYGCIYLGKNVRLNAEDQNNFEGSFTMIKDYLSDGIPSEYIFPITFKIWTNPDGTPVFMSYNSIGELKSFIYSGKIFIQACLASGWALKNALAGKSLDELKAWVDPR